MAKTESGYLLIADITGYTMYLSQSELEHAHHVLQTLLELLMEHTRPPLVISRLAGDAVISYGLRDKFLSGQTFVELIEDTYIAFRKAINLMVLNNTCQCNACANISTLDLKFFVHYGAFMLQRLDEHDELVGTDVNLIHRLLKNHVTEETGYRAYTLYTDAAVRQLGLEDICESMTPHTERYEHLGEAKTHIQDMHPVWEAKKDRTQIEIAPGEWLAREEAEFPLPLHQLWDIVTNPEYRALLLDSVRQKIHDRRNGRLAPGSVYQCFHGGNRVTTQTILEWRPFEQMTTEDTTPVPRATCLVNIRLTPIESGTRVAFTCSKARGPWLSRVMCNLVGGFLVRAQFANGMREFRARLERELAQGKHTLVEAAAISSEQIGEAVAASLRET